MSIISKNNDIIRITVEYNKLNTISCVSQLSFLRVGEVLDPQGKGCIFRLFGLVSLFNQITTHMDIINP